MRLCRRTDFIEEINKQSIMSDHVVESSDGGDGSVKQYMHSCQSVWMAHWTQTSCRAEPEFLNRTSLRLENNDACDANKHHLISGMGIASNFSTFTRRFTELPESSTVRSTNECQTAGSKTLMDERLDCHSFPMLNLFQNMRNGLDTKNDLDISCHRQVSRPQIDCNTDYNPCSAASHLLSVLAVAPPAAENSSKGCDFQSEGVSQNPEELINSSKVVPGGSLAFVGPCQDNLTGSTQMVPYTSNRGKTPVSSFMNRQQKINQLSSCLASKEPLSNTKVTVWEHDHCNAHGQNALLIRKKKFDDRSTFGNFGNSFFKQSSSSLLLNNSSTGNDHSPLLVGEQSPKMLTCSESEFIPSWSSPPEATKSEKLYHGCYSLQKMPHSIPDGESMRCSTINPVEGLGGDPAIFSEATHSLLFMKKTDVNVVKENKTFRERRAAGKFRRNMFSELLNLSTPLSRQLKPQPLGSSTDSEGKDNVEDVKTPEVNLKNESSADTDTMDMDALEEQNYLSGINSSTLNRDILASQNSASQSAIAPAGGEAERRLAVTNLPDINAEPVVPAALSLMDNAEPSPSRTQSLDAELLLSRAEQPHNPESIPNFDGHPRLEPGNRWLKRFRTSSDLFALGTKFSHLGEASSHRKANKLFSNIIRGSTTSSLEPVSPNDRDKEDMAAEQTAIRLRNVESPSVDSVKKDQDMLLSHSWIQRWCHSRASTRQKQPAVVDCEPQSTKVMLGELQNKQFPSIAAMALMGKAMNGFQPCEFQRRGSFMVWNA